MEQKELKKEKKLIEWFGLNYIAWKFLPPIVFLLTTVHNYEGGIYKQIFIAIALSYGLYKYWQVCDVYEDSYNNRLEDSK